MGRGDASMVAAYTTEARSTIVCLWPWVVGMRRFSALSRRCWNNERILDQTASWEELLGGVLFIEGERPM